MVFRVFFQVEDAVQNENIGDFTHTRLRKKHDENSSQPVKLVTVKINLRRRRNHVIPA